MVRKIIALALCVAIFTAIGGVSHASAYSIYNEGNMSTTYVSYFRDIVSGIGFNENYVAFRSGQYEYTMIVGELDYNSGKFTLSGDTATVYTFAQETSGYNSQYTYNVSSIDTLNLSVNERIIYSDLGQFPQLVARGEKYEILTTLLILIMLFALVVYNMLRSR